MRKLLLVLAIATAIVMLPATAAMANPGSAPGAGDPTDVANVATVAAFGDGSDVPGPHHEGVSNNPNFGPHHGSFHSVTNNPACAGHAPLGDHS